MTGSHEGGTDDSQFREEEEVDAGTGTGTGTATGILTGIMGRGWAEARGTVEVGAEVAAGEAVDREDTPGILTVVPTSMTKTGAWAT